jgi:hypothetical protein
MSRRETQGPQEQDPQSRDSEVFAPLSRDAIHSELINVLSSPPFRMSKRSQDFLRYVVEATLAGKGDTLKERTIAVEVFGKDLSYETNEDPVVRVKAGDIRKRLGMYYSTRPNHSGVVIDLPSGSYVPEFRFVASRPEQEQASGNSTDAPASPEISSPEAADVLPAPLQVNAPPQALAKISARKLWGGAILVAAASLALIVAGLHKSPTVFDQFWDPVLNNPSPIIIAAAYAPVYLAPDPRITHTTHYTLVKDGYVGGGDLAAATSIGGMLGTKHHLFQVRIGDSVTFEDLSNAPSILIGYSSHFWDPITKEFRYFIKEDDGMVLDYGKPTGWGPRNVTADLHVDDDYAIISRAFHPQTHKMMILVVGSEQYGTQAAAELITNPELLAEAFQGAPRDWQKKNFQIVLHVKIIGNSPAVPQVVASYYW